MGISGNLDTMSLTDLLRWASLNNKTGVLELERNKVQRRLVFREGRVVGCSSDDPPSRLGQFLLSRGRVTENALREALRRQETDQRTLAIIFEEMGVLPREEVNRLVAEKAEETIYGLFDWTDATFRFEPNAPPDRYTIDIDISVQQMLTQGLQRHEELTRIREVFRTSAIVLQRTELPVPPEIASGGMAAQILEAVDGERTLAEVLLHVRGSEYLVVRFLFNLYHRDAVKIVGQREIDANASPTLLEVPGESEAAAESGPATLEVDLSAIAIAHDIEAGRDATPPPAVAPHEEPDPVVHRDAPAGHDELLKSAIDLEEAPDAPQTAEPVAPPPQERGSALGGAIQVAQELLGRGDYDAGLQVLNGCYRSNPGDNYVRHLIFQAESAYMEYLRSGDLAPSKIPVRTEKADAAEDANLQPTEAFLLNMVDGGTDIKSMLWVAPMREVDIFLALRQLHEKGLIRLEFPDGNAAAADGGDPVAVHWA